MTTPPKMTCGDAQVAPMAPGTLAKDSLVAMTFGGVAADPHVPWFLLPRSSFAPMTSPPNPFAPYTSGLASDPPDNPPTATGFPFHPNITRHWANGTTSYVVVIPRSVPQRAPGLPDLSQLVSTTFPGLPVHPTYTWNDWVNDVQAVFGHYNAVQTADVNVTFAGAVYESQTYARSEGAAAALIGPYIWPSTSSGPTGNGVNEIILTDQPILGLGLASMLVDPATGLISECDLIFDVGASTANGPGATPPTSPGGFFQAVGANVTSPREWTGLHHEIGHFYGLDHTNLHSGVPTLPVLSYAPISLAGTSRATYPTTLSNPQIPPFPMMAGFITHLGVGANVAAPGFLLPSDDQVGLSIIYPVDMPRPLSPKVPLINLTASFRGKCLEGPAGLGVFGRNVWVVKQELLDVANIGYPVVGVLSGTARNTDDSLVLGSGSLYLDNRTTLNFPFYPTSSWVGDTGIAAVPPVSNAPLNSGGDFSVDGIPVDADIDIDLFDLNTDPGEYDVVFEGSNLLGVSAANQAEWITTSTTAFYSGNNIYGPSPVIPYAMTSLENIDPMAPGPPPGIASKAQSLSVVQGTVIHINPADNNDDQLILNPSQGTPPLGWESALATHSGTPIDRFREQQVRPLVSITPRMGRSTASNVVITARLDTVGGPTSPFGFDYTKARLFVNGVTYTLPAPTVTSTAPGFPTIVPAPGAARWTISMATLVAFAGVTKNQPINLVCLVPATIVATSPPQVFGIDPGNVAQARTIVLGVGRNDVVL